MTKHSIHPARCRSLNTHQYQQGPIIYWMSRDQRVEDNWALLHAAQRAHHEKVPFAVVFCLTPSFLGANRRHYDFMLRGLQEVAAVLAHKQIAFFLLLGDVLETLPAFCHTHQVGEIIVDFSPLHVGRNWRDQLAQQLTIPVTEVDAHNVVPVWYATSKLEVGARTLRPKIHRLLPEFLSEFPQLPETLAWKSVPTIDWSRVNAQLKVDEAITPVTWLIPGTTAAHQQLQTFLQERLSRYDELRNDPAAEAQSNLSPYLHYGQLSAQRVALEVQRKYPHPTPASEAYLEELIVRRELADNFCFYQPQYDSVAGFPNWAQKTLSQHQGDTRETIYNLVQLETAQTHDELWNAAQREMVNTGKMHGYLRMYWAKKILEWSPDATTALKHAIYLNDRYELDGRDPNGYTGIAWSIGGVHDRPWFDRPIFGMVRYMNRSGADKKFDTKAYIAQHS